MPGATDPVAGLEDTEVVEAGLVELDRGADPREAPADDNDFVVGGSDIRNIHVPKGTNALSSAAERACLRRTGLGVARAGELGGHLAGPGLRLGDGGRVLARGVERCSRLDQRLELRAGFAEQRHRDSLTALVRFHRAARLHLAARRLDLKRGL